MANSRKRYNDRLNISGEKIKEIRLEKGLSREALSSKLILEGIDISASAIANIENNTRTIVDYELCGITKVLNIHVSFLLKDYHNK